MHLFSFFFLVFILLCSGACTRERIASDVRSEADLTSSKPAPTQDSKRTSYLALSTALACAGLNTANPLTAERRAGLLQEHGWTEVEYAREHAEVSKDPKTQRALFAGIEACTSAP